MLRVIAVSDATGETAERVIRSALVQFPGASVEVVRIGGVRDAARLQEVVARAAETESLIVHTLVSDELRHRMVYEARGHGVDALDLMGPLLERLVTHLHVSPQEKPGLFKQLTEARSREIEAVDFAFTHDDGERADELDRAEVVLVGVSRTMKTPTMLCLAYRGWFAANVPIIPGIPLPTALMGLSPECVFLLTMAGQRLVQLRRARVAQQGIPAGYAAVEAVREELRAAEAVARKHGWRRIDVTGKSAEEVARQIATLLPGEAGHRPR